jgi:large subunit ribosomal protein L25
VSVSEINAEIRTEFGKGGARRTRRAGKLPAVLYGHGEQPRHVALPALAFATAIRYGGMTNVLTLTFPDGTTATALPKAIQRDPLKNTYEHADLLLVRRGEKVTVEIPVVLVGEAARGTLVMHEHATIAVSADATQLPHQLEASIEGLNPGERVTAAQVKLPAGAELAVDPEMVVAMIGVSSTAEELAGAEVPAEAGAEAGEPEAAEPSSGAPSES